MARSYEIRERRGFRAWREGEWGWKWARESTQTYRRVNFATQHARTGNGMSASPDNAERYRNFKICHVWFLLTLVMANNARVT